MLKIALLLSLVGLQGLWAQQWPQERGGGLPDFKFTPLELNLFRHLLQLEGDESITFSPLSIRSLLAMVKQGTRGATRTSLEGAIGETRGIEGLLSYPPRGGITMGNSFYLSNNLEINDSFRDILTSKYKAEFQYADFSRPRSAAYNINEWVRRITDKGISEIISPDALSADSIFMMVNAIHLKAKWKEPFDTEQTSDGVFYESQNGALVPKIGPIMQQFNSFRIGSVASLNAQVLELPFQTPERHSMYIVLPNDPNGLRQMIANLKPESLKEILQSLGGQVQLTLSMPKFSASTSKSLRTILPQNVAAIFEPTADVSGISPDRNIQLTDIVHKATLKVDEEGAIGSAATAVHAVLLSNTPPVHFNASHPFMYFITEHVQEARYSGYSRQSNLEIYFMGHVSKLEESQELPGDWGQISLKQPERRNNGGTGGNRRTHQ